MDRETYRTYEAYMLSQMEDSAHDCQHVYRVLYLALDIAHSEDGVGADVLLAACLLHDIGRQREFEDPALCHAAEGGAMAYDYLLSQGWGADRAAHVQSCIASHRYRTDRLPDSIEARILFDADKIEAAGAMGIARTILYSGQVNRPLYAVDEAGHILEETGDKTFIREYNGKLKGIYERFYTKRGREIAEQRRAAAVSFYNSMLHEVNSAYEQGRRHLDEMLI